VPFDRKRYPPNWEEIRARILDRDEHRCKFCGVPNNERIWRDSDGDWHTTGNDQSLYSVGGNRVVKIVLTIAHLHDPDPMNCEDGNLAALCQRCHLRLDAPLHASNARITRARKAGQGAML
jgi:hypothetical protein